MAKRKVLSGMPGSYYAALGGKVQKRERAMDRADYWQKRTEDEKQEDLKARRMERIKQATRGDYWERRVRLQKEAEEAEKHLINAHMNTLFALEPEG